MSTAKFNTWLNPDGTQNYKCRAWVNFIGTGTVSIRAAGNVDSITDLGTGNYRVNFATAMPDANYSLTGFSQGGSNGTNVTFLAMRDAPLTTSCSVRQQASGGGGGGDTDAGIVCVAVFR